MKDAIALVIEGDVLVGFKTEALIEAVFWKPLIGGVRLVVAEVGGLNKAQLGLKAGADVEKILLHVEGVAGALQTECAGGTGAVRWRRAAVLVAHGGAFHHLSPSGPMLIESSRKVDAADAVPALTELFVGVDRAQARSLAQVFRDAAHGDGGVLAVERIAGGDGLAGLAIVGDKESEIGVIDLSRHADAVLGMHDVARVDEIDGRDKVVGVLEKEGPQLGKVDGEALIDGELRLLGFDVAEVGVDGGVDHDAVFEDELGFAAAGAFKVARTEEGVGGIDVDQVALVLGKSVGVQLEVVRAGDALDAVQNCLLAQDASDIGGNARPEILLGVAGEITDKDDAPIGFVAAKTETAEGDGDERHPAVFGHAAFGIPHGVVAEVGAVGLAP